MPAQGLLAEQNIAPTTPVSQVYASQAAGKQADLSGVTALDQCMTEQAYVRDSITRSLIYNQARPPGPFLCCSLDLALIDRTRRLQGSSTGSTAFAESDVGSLSRPVKAVLCMAVRVCRCPSADKCSFSGVAQRFLVVPACSFVRCACPRGCRAARLIEGLQLCLGCLLSDRAAVLGARAGVNQRAGAGVRGAHARLVAHHARGRPDLHRLLRRPGGRELETLTPTTSDSHTRDEHLRLAAALGQVPAQTHQKALPNMVLGGGALLPEGLLPRRCRAAERAHSQLMHTCRMLIFPR